jgi:hypothetical protein
VIQTSPPALATEIGPSATATVIRTEFVAGLTI